MESFTYLTPHMISSSRFGRSSSGRLNLSGSRNPPTRPCDGCRKLRLRCSDGDRSGCTTCAKRQVDCRYGEPSFVKVSSKRHRVYGSIAGRISSSGSGNLRAAALMDKASEYDLMFSDSALSSDSNCYETTTDAYSSDDEDGALSRIEQNRQLLDRLMQHFYAVFTLCQPVRAAGYATHGSGTVGTTSLSPDVRSASTPNDAIRQTPPDPAWQEAYRR